MTDSEKLARDEAAKLETDCYVKGEVGPLVRAASKRGWDACAAYRDASQAKASVELNLEDHACRTGDCEHTKQIECDQALASFQFKQANTQAKASAEFPFVEFEEFCNKNGKRFPAPTLQDCGLWAFEKGRASSTHGISKDLFDDVCCERDTAEAKLRDSVTNDWVCKNTVNISVHEDLQAKLREANAVWSKQDIEIQSLMLSRSRIHFELKEANAALELEKHNRLAAEAEIERLQKAAQP